MEKSIMSLFNIVKRLPLAPVLNSSASKIIISQNLHKCILPVPDHTTNVPLGITAVIASFSESTPINPFSTQLKQRKSRRAHLYMLQSAARDLLPDERIHHCLRTPSAQSVQVLYSAAVKSAHYGGLQTCGSVWNCPVCASKISERRRLELDALTKKHTGTLSMVTFTVQHDRDDSLSLLLDTFLKTIRKLKSGSIWQKIKKDYGIIGSIRALEVTHGHVNGWHPHSHILFFHNKNISSDEFRKRLSERWVYLAKKAGLYASPEIGVDVQSADTKVAEYVSKFGSQWNVTHELTKGNIKEVKSTNNRSIVDLLNDYLVKNDKQAGALFAEYAKAFKNKHQLQGLAEMKKILSPDEDIKTDEELAKETREDSIILASLNKPDWKIIIANDARAELLNVADSGNIEDVWIFLEELGIERSEIPQFATFNPLKKRKKQT